MTLAGSPRLHAPLGHPGVRGELDGAEKSEVCRRRAKATAQRAEPRGRKKAGDRPCQPGLDSGRRCLPDPSR